MRAPPAARGAWISAGAGIGVHQPDQLASASCRSSGCRRPGSPYSRKAGPNSRRSPGCCRSCGRYCGGGGDKRYARSAQLAACSFCHSSSSATQLAGIGAVAENVEIEIRGRAGFPDRAHAGKNPRHIFIVDRHQDGGARRRQSAGGFSGSRSILFEARQGAEHRQPEGRRRSRRTGWRTGQG